MRVLSVLLSVALLKLCASAELYKGFKAYDVTPDGDQIDALLDWQYEDGVDFWRAGAAGRLSRVMIPPNLQNAFENFLKTHSIQYTVHIDDVAEVEKVFEADRIRRLERKKTRSAIVPLNNPDFGVYWTTQEIEEYSRRLAATYPQYVQREVIATSYDGAEVFALKLSSGGFENKPIIFMDGGMHAREWVSQATVMYFIHRMVEDPITRAEMLTRTSWIIIPNLNPDGYTWSYNQNRMWRQNRHRINATCIGVDLNRNWPYSWRTPNPNTCGGLTYGGENPLSEVETSAENDYMTRYRANVRLYMSIHSFGDMMLYPWGYQGSPGNITNWQYHHQVGSLWADAIRNHSGKNIRVGNIADILGNAFGASDDHMAGGQGINLSYTLELTGGGLTGFDFPESQLRGLEEESFWGYRAYGLFVSQTYQ